MSVVTFQIPEETLLALRMVPETAGAELRLAAAMKLLELGRLSTGGAAQLAGIPKPALLSRMEEYGVSTFRLTAEELRQDASNA